MTAALNLHALRWVGMRRARRHVVRREAAAALAACDLQSPEILSRLGLHAAVLNCDPRRDGRSDRMARLISGVALADGGALRGDLGDEALRQLRATAPERVRLSLALAAGASDDVEAAIAVMPAGARLARGALLLKSGDSAAAERLVRDVGHPSADLYALKAAIACRRGDGHAAQQHLAAAIGASGLALPPATRFGSDGFPVGGVAPEPADGAPVALVTIIMPARNAADHNSTAGRSILNQTYAALELIVVDDASTDDTTGAALSAARGDCRLRVLRLDRHLGAYGARNRGLTAARGALIGFQDADDWSHPGRIARGVARLGAVPALVATVSRLIRLGPDGTPVSPRVFPLARLAPSGLILRRAPVMAALGGFETVPVGADTEFLARIITGFGADRVDHDPAIGQLARLRPGSLTWGGRLGLDSAAGRRVRLAYWESWHRRHVEILRGRARAFVDPAGPGVSIDGASACADRALRANSEAEPP